MVSKKFLVLFQDRQTKWLNRSQIGDGLMSKPMSKPCYKTAERILHDIIIDGQQRFLVLFKVKDRQSKWLSRPQIDCGLILEYIQYA